MPTLLPPPRRAAPRTSVLRTAFNVMFNTALVVSALILTFIVLLREEQFTQGGLYGPPIEMPQTLQHEVPTAGDPAAAQPN